MVTTFQVGEHVTARWEDGGFYGGTIVQAEGARYLVRWDDGSDPVWVDASSVVSESAGPVVGAHVRARFTDGIFYGGRVTEFDGARCLVAWDDESPALWVALTDIQAHPAGTHMLAKWEDGGMYGGTLGQFNGTHYSVAWDDGSPATWIAARDIQPE